MRYVIAVIGLVVVAGGLGAVKYKQISGLISAGKEMQKMGPPPETVSTAKAQQQTWQDTLTAVGSISPERGVTVSNEVPGVVTAIRFESGALVKEGQVLVELDSSVERAQLASARARKDLAGVTVGRSRSLVQAKAAPQSQLDSDEASLKSSNADAMALQAQIERKTIRAPFSGRLGIRGVNLGQYLNPGTAITVLQATDASYVDFTLPQQHLADLTVGLPVQVTLEGEAKPTSGVITAIDPTVDATTRSIRVRSKVEGAADKLRAGMFVQVAVVLPSALSRVIVPVTAVVHASYGDSVFIVEGGSQPQAPRTARQQFVRTGETRGDYVAILDGVKPNEEVVSAGAFKLRNGAPVVVNNDSVKQDPKLAPHPENR